MQGTGVEKPGDPEGSKAYAPLMLHHHGPVFYLCGTWHAIPFHMHIIKVIHCDFAGSLPAFCLTSLAWVLNLAFETEP